METEPVLKSLARYDGSFPRTALERAIEQKESITPHLLDALRFARQHVEALPEGYWLHTWAMFLLAQFRETRAYALVIDLLDLPGEQLEELHGDGLTEDMNRILASVCGGDPGLIERLAEKPEADQYARDAALGALVTLVATGQRSREETLEYFRGLFHTSQAQPDSFFWSALVRRSTDLYPDSVYEEIKDAYDRQLVDPLFIALRNVDQVLARGKDAVLAALGTDRHYTLVEDTVRETEWWACFRQAPSPPATPGIAAETPVAPRLSSPAPVQAERPASVGPKPGRNDPCPCGSGLKYKRCCLKRASA